MGGGDDGSVACEICMAKVRLVVVVVVVTAAKEVERRLDIARTSTSTPAFCYRVLGLFGASSSNALTTGGD